MSRNNYDALIDQLLREILGGDRPRDITARVMAQAKIHDRFRRRVWLSAGSAIAACIAIAAGLMVLWPREYPGTRVVGGDVYSANGNDTSEVLYAGNTVVTKENDGTIDIGRYVKVVMAPETSVTLGGKKYEENVVLNQGHVDVQVTKNKGKFDVLVGQAVVHVTGTKFGLDLQESMTDDANVRTLFVSVDEGSVDVKGVKNPKVVTAGNRDAFVISDEPILKRIAPTSSSASTSAPAPAPAAPPAVTPKLRLGIGAGMQEGARIGNRGINRPIQDAGRGGLLSGQNRVQAAEVASVLRSVQIYSGTEPFERTGTVRQVGAFDILETSQGTYLLFPHAAPTLKDFHATDRPMRVVWREGTIKSIEPVTPTSRPASTAPTATPNKI